MVWLDFACHNQVIKFKHIVSLQIVLEKVIFRAGGGGALL